MILAKQEKFMTALCSPSARWPVLPDWSGRVVGTYGRHGYAGPAGPTGPTGLNSHYLAARAIPGRVERWPTKPAPAGTQNGQPVSNTKPGPRADFSSLKPIW